MRSTLLLVLGITLFFFIKKTNAQENNHAISIDIKVADELKKDCKKDGRFLVFIVKHKQVEPRYMTWPSPRIKTYIYGKTVSNFNPNERIQVSDDWTSTGPIKLSNVPEGEYSIQVLYDQSNVEASPNEAGNLYSTSKVLDLNKNQAIELIIDSKIEKTELVDHPLVRLVRFKSPALSKFWDKPMYLKASILLPKNYDKNKAYPIRYNVSGYGGRYTRINRIVRNKRFMDWYTSEDAPEIISVYLDGDGPFGDSYQMDSENSGPYGEALINELIPHIEKEYRGSQSAKTRFVDGCSTGGWVSLGLQLYYPDSFNGCFSYSPDAVEFENYQLTNIYKDDNVYVNEYGIERPVMRSLAGEPMLTSRQFLQYENVLGRTNTYVTSGGQFSAHTALYGPKGEDGFPKPLFNPITGKINPDVANHWQKYDFKKHLENKPYQVKEKLDGKIYVWMGDMDNFYLNEATRQFSKFFEKSFPDTKATFEFDATMGHCTKFNNKRVLEQVQERLESME